MDASKDLNNDNTPESEGGAASLSGPMAGVNICVVGGGFVGTITAAGFAKFGHNVLCVENNPDHLAKLQAGRLPFYEQGLEDLIRNGIVCKRLSFSANLEQAVKGRKAIFLAVGTPSSNTGRTDIKALEEIIKTLSACLKPNQIIVIRSTVPIGTAKHFKKFLKDNSDEDNSIPIISNPEFLREGSAVHDFFYPHRIVIGGDSPEAINLISHVYRMGMTNHVPIITTNNETAEMIKYASNTFLAMKVGFVNELAELCDSVGVNTLEVARAMGIDSRIGHEFLDPGPGWGGSCLPKDLKEFLGLADSRGVSLLILKAVLEANRKQHDYVISKVKNLVGSLKGKQIGALGLTFKAETSDLRGSPAVAILRQLIGEGVRVKAYDPVAGDEASKLLPDVEIVGSAYDAVKDADCVLILTEWTDFQSLDWQKIAKLMKQQNIVDARNILSSKILKRYSYNYLGMGQV